MPSLVAELQAQFAESLRLEQTIKAHLRGMGMQSSRATSAPKGPNAIA